MRSAFAKEVLATLRKHGSDVTQPHEFEFFIQVRRKKDATIAVAKFRSNDFTAEASRSGKTWTVAARKKIVPAKVDLADYGRFFGEVASALGGFFDGWEVELQEE